MGWISDALKLTDEHKVAVKEEYRRYLARTWNCDCGCPPCRTNRCEQCELGFVCRNPYAEG